MLFYLGVAGQVEEVICVSVLGVDFVSQLVDGVFVGNVPDHEGGPPIVLYIFRLDDKRY